MLEIDGLVVSYGNLVAVDRVALKVNRGEIVSIIGSNGAGKSSVLKAISGIVRAQEGQIKFSNKRIDLLYPHEIVELGVVQVPEGRRLFPYLTVEENLLVGSYPKRARSRRAETLKIVFGLFPILSERSHQLAETLSGGEQQMLAIGRGLMSNPELLMLDEPSQGLAPVVTERLFESLKFTKERDITLLLVEQNTHYALELADRAYVLENGLITLEGSGKELLDDSHVKRAYLGL